ncbi:MAG TPA: epoxide hydrolase [Vicinamibacterales bacterium]|nr:epoxide hydrolase [Vicinamibacterales bacterium]
MTYVRYVAAAVSMVTVLAPGGFAYAQRPAESAAASSPAIVPFKIHVPDGVLSDLKRRLAQSRFADEFPDAGWDYGTNLAYLRSLVDYWRDRYDWRAQEKRLNAFDQFKTNIDGVDIHFIHQRSKNPNAMPLLLLNGWPSSIVEYEKVIGALTDPVAHGGRAEDSFDVVIPSMPGFGFSGKPRERGYDPERIARMWVQLMARLGYTRYSAHGSDWGNGIATRVALDDPAHVVAIHIAGCGAAPVAPAANNGNQPRALLPNNAVNAAHNLGYQEIQTTKPQTLGQALSDSPVGLASWIVEKWYGWADHDGDLEKVVTKDELLTNVMIYWVTNSGASSARIYYESRHMLGGLAPTPFPRPDGRVSAPTGCGSFPRQYDRRDLPVDTSSAAARQVAEARYNVVHFTTMPRGGHFPAFEQPQLWMDDIRAFFATVRKTQGLG